MIQIVSVIPYVRDIFKGTTRPNIVSYFLWTVIQVIAIFAQFSAGASWSLFILIAVTFNTSLIFILCLFGYGYKNYGLMDKICFVLAAITIIIWQITKQPLIVLALAIFTDFLASLPTIVKAYRDPKSEMVLPWFMTVVTAALAGFSTTKIDFANLIYPVYAFFTNVTITGFAFFGQRREARQNYRS